MLTSQHYLPIRIQNVLLIDLSVFLSSDENFVNIDNTNNDVSLENCSDTYFVGYFDV